MVDLSSTVIPKSDQLNTDDLIAGPLTIEITSVSLAGGTDQPINISYIGDNGNPWKPTKTKRRVLVQAWGADGSKYTGRRLTVFRDESVKWAGVAIGGIRISHMSDIVGQLTTSLTITRGQKRPYTVLPLPKQAPVEQKFTITDADYVAWTSRMDGAKTQEDLERVGVDIRAVANSYDEASRGKLVAYFKNRKTQLAEADPMDDIISTDTSTEKPAAVEDTQTAQGEI